MALRKSSSLGEVFFLVNRVDFHLDIQYVLIGIVETPLFELQLLRRNQCSNAPACFEQCFTGLQ